METVAAKACDMLDLFRRDGPALCNITITNSCNATRDFCNFARGKVAKKALAIYRRKPLLRRAGIAMTVERGIGKAMITNGWLLPLKLDELAAAGLKTLYVSIDAATSPTGR